MNSVDCKMMTIDVNQDVKCELCGSVATLKWLKHPGYREDSSYDIYHCRSCDTSFASPLKVDEAIYEAIYSQVQNIPGYERYFNYLEKAKTSIDPLSMLSEVEDVYWAIARYFQMFESAHDKKILEVGSGMGYLTFSLKKRGYDVTGIDLSKSAVDRAKENFGDLYQCTHLSDFSKLHEGEYTEVIMTELIEHIPDVYDLLLDVDRVLKPGGNIVISTPNKSAFNAEVLWETDPPPVHLWWFSEQSIIEIANKIGYQVSFIDFSEYNKKHKQIIKFRREYSRPTRNSILLENNSIAVDPIATRIHHNLLNIKEISSYLDIAFKIAFKITSRRRTTMCAVLKKKSI